MKGFYFMKNDFFQSVFLSISQGVKEDYEFYFRQRPLVTHNSKGFFKWDIINTNILENLKESNIEVRIAKMGGWTFLLLLDSDTGILYSLMNIKRFNSIYRCKKKYIPLYIQALISLNKTIDLSAPTLFDCEVSNSGLDEILSRFSDLFSKRDSFLKSNYKIITYTTDLYDELVGLHLKTLDSNFELVSDENLLDCVKPEFPNHIEQFKEDEISSATLRITKKGEQRKGEKVQVSLRSIVEKKASATYEKI